MFGKITPKQAIEMVNEALNHWDFAADEQDGDATRKGLEYLRDRASDRDTANSLNAMRGDKWDRLYELAANYGRQL